MRSNSIEAVLGAIVLVIAGFFLVFAYSSSQKNEVSGYNLLAKFEKVDGILIGSDIKLAGVKVGTIKTINIDPSSYQAVVTFSMKETLQIPVDSTASIVSEGLMGGKYISINPGMSQEMLKENGEITLTQSSLNFESLIGKYLLGGGSSSKEEKTS